VIADITEIEVAYAAGIFDGEGCIHIAPYRKRGRPYHRLMVAVTNTDFPLLDWLHARWGGHLGKPLLTNRHRPCKIWALSEGYAYPFLNAVYPYLIVKRRQAELALQFMNARSPGTHGRRPDDAATGRRAELHRQLQALRR
jgi:hypothetical protein